MGTMWKERLRKHYQSRKNGSKCLVCCHHLTATDILHAGPHPILSRLERPKLATDLFTCFRLITMIVTSNHSFIHVLFKFFVSLFRCLLKVFRNTLRVIYVCLSGRY